jgi:FtsP/CotA-like multicopper oxidase with cupredoxin domain
MASRISRREFVRLAGLSTAAVSFGGIFTGNLLVKRASAQPDGLPDLEIALRAVATEVSILPGMATRVWKYEGEVIQGNPDSLQFLETSYLGPIFRVRTGQRLRIHFTNQLPEETIVHWHGLRLPEEMDGHPRYAIAPQQTYTYDFTVTDRAGTYWYHPHPHMLTGGQVYNGLAGLFIVEDEEQDALGLPTGVYDIPLVIQDRTFDVDGQLIYLSAGMMSRAMTQMMGFLGDMILINGQPDFGLSVEARAYRLRLLNGSNSRIYKLGWADGTPLTVIGTDGGLLEQPVQREYVVVSPGERVELWTDFSSYPVGTELRLKSLPFSGVEMGGMMMGMMGGMETSLPHGSEFTVLRVRVDREASQNVALPESLSNLVRHRVEEAVNVLTPPLKSQCRMSSG